MHGSQECCRYPQARNADSMNQMLDKVYKNYTVDDYVRECVSLNNINCTFKVVSQKFEANVSTHLWSRKWWKQCLKSWSLWKEANLIQLLSTSTSTTHLWTKIGEKFWKPQQMNAQRGWNRECWKFKGNSKQLRLTSEKINAMCSLWLTLPARIWKALRYFLML